MDVIAEILSWSEDRPLWQRDALRRLILKGGLSEDDLSELTTICKSVHGLSDHQDVQPLDRSHVPNDDTTGGTVKLLAITHHRGVNALAEEQKITFGSGLTVAYGDNAAGKSGYTRILKSACKARGAEEILGNVLSDAVPLSPSASIGFTVGDDSTEQQWTDNDDAVSPLGRISVFDSHSAAVYLKEKTDVAFRPFGLDLFDKLSKACEDISERLDRERRALESTRIRLPDLPEGTSAYKLVSGLSSLTKRENVTALATLSTEESEQMTLLEKRLADVRTENPMKTAGTLRLRAERLHALVEHLNLIDASLKKDSLKDVFDAQATARLKAEEASKCRDTTFPPDLLAGTGSDVWRELWEAAGRFSTKSAYVDKPYPFLDSSARCLLCQQVYDSDSARRMKQFQEFLASQIEQESKKARESFDTLYRDLRSLDVSSKVIDDAVKELQIESEDIAAALDNELKETSSRHSRSLEALQANAELPSDLPVASFPKEKIKVIVRQLNHRADEILKQSDQKEIEKIQGELQELRARAMLSKYEKDIFAEIERKAKLAAYELCSRDTKTTAITRKSTEVTREAVTKKLQGSFKEELKKFRFTHVEVELQESGGERGALYHRLILTRAPGISLPRVVSEGEARCLSIAAFFAELSTADDPSSILFDDPVSSLDHKWRTSVARRLAEESRSRQVVVFTHDIVFLLALHRFAGELKLDLHDQYLRREKLGAGVSKEELPWAAMKVKKRIGILKNNWQAASKLHSEGKQVAYEREATIIYGQLRETWERALEEVLLDGVIERFRENVQTQQIRKLSDISEQDCETLETGMAKCSKWLTGHDQAPAAKEDIPEPNELKGDIDNLEQWVKTINKRRQ